MHIAYDPAKNQRNIDERQLPFDQASEFDFESALIQVDARRDYSETRYIALGFLHGRLHVLCFTETHDGIRVISFRKANSREVSRYAKVQAND
ncbi:MAG: BrnT family toxin [Cellvibrionales bacterium]|nr:MAG: BrnT family toxin [Cellvibrionales bacterium]